jgi:hypothetical protein
MRAGVVEVRADRMPKPLLRPKVLRRATGPRLKAGKQRLEGRDVELLLRPEVLEDEAVRDAGRGGDVIDRDVLVIPREELLEGDLEELLAPP